MKLTRITTVRHREEDGKAMLERFMFRGMYGGARVPRGIEPAVVSAFLRDRIRPDSAPDSVARAAEVARFYESADAVPHFQAMLTGRETDVTAMVRSAWLLQIVADLGTPDQVKRAAEYFDQKIVAHPRASSDFGLLLQTALALAPTLAPDALKQRMARDVAAAEKNQRASEDAMMAYDRLAAVQRNELPRVQAAIDAKRKLAAQQPPDRRAELVLIYLLRHPAANEYLSTWSARMLRKEAMDADADPVNGEFAKALDTADKNKLGKPAYEFQVARGVQAIIYLQGKPPAKHVETYKQIEAGAMNFLWDDPPAP
jgi:hypothetical protein